MHLNQKYVRKISLISLLTIVALVLAACMPATPAAEAEPEETPEVLPPTGVLPNIEVSDQEVVDSTVTIDQVDSDGPGWVVIHADENGSPGPVIGHEAALGNMENLAVEIDNERATETLHAMLHTDAGTIGEYEFPGADVPVEVEGEIVVEPFQATGLPEAEMEATPAATEEAASAAPASVSMIGQTFDPATLTIPAGTTVTWTNESSLPHTVTADDGSFASGTVNTGGTFEFTFDEPGDYPYYCEFHGGPGGQGMSGTITVTGE